MRRNVIWVLLIFFVPLALYWSLTKNELASLPSIAADGDEIIKFASPMCYECQELEKVFNQVCPKYNKQITVRKVDVTKSDKNTKELIKEYNIKLVPTTIFKNQDGQITRRVEGMFQPETMEKYIEELING